MRPSSRIAEKIRPGQTFTAWYADRVDARVDALVAEFLAKRNKIFETRLSAAEAALQVARATGNAWKINRAAVDVDVARLARPLTAVAEILCDVEARVEAEIRAKMKNSSKDVQVDAKSEVKLSVNSTTTRKPTGIPEIS